MRIDENDHIQLVDIDLLRVELKRLYAIEKANTPFASRAEVETYLKGKGFESKPDGLWLTKVWLVRFTDDGNLYVNHDIKRCQLDIPLSAVTRATLRACGVIE